MIHHTLGLTFLLVACFQIGDRTVNGFAVGNGLSIVGRQRPSAAAAADTTPSRLLAAAASTTRTTLSLPKPLGLILEEVEEGKASGVFVASVSDAGSAVAHASDIVGTKLVSVQGQAVTQLDFDSVMDKIINAPATVELVFDGKGMDTGGESATNAPVADFAIGTNVKIVVLNGSKDGKSNLEINAKVGDNLRQTLLDNGFEVYQGLKQKLGNCGGAGQCTFCAMDFIESEGWLERSDYEDSKLKQRNPKARLACLNNIQGPATIQKAQR